MMGVKNSGKTTLRNQGVTKWRKQKIEKSHSQHEPKDKFELLNEEFEGDMNV